MGLSSNGRVWAVPFLALVVLTQLLFAGDKPTSLAEARNAVDANLRAPEGKKYDEHMGNEFVQNTSPPCVNASRLRAMTCATSGSFSNSIETARRQRFCYTRKPNWGSVLAPRF
jgi:hypothetical protein